MDDHTLFKSLSYIQHDVIRSLLRDDSYVANRSCTNSTLSALERRGLVSLKFENGKFPRSKWSLTALGRKLAQL